MTEASSHPDPVNAQDWYAQGQQYLQQGDIAKALTSFNLALKIKPDFKEAGFELARVLEDTGHLETAIKTHEYLLKLELASGSLKPPLPLSDDRMKTVKKWFEKGLKDHKSCNYKDAEKAFRKVLALYPDMPEALSNLGLALYHLHEYAQAEEAVLRCLCINPAHVDAFNVLGVCYKDTGHYARAVAAWRQALAAQPDYMPAILNLSAIHYENENVVETLKAHELALAIEPDHVEVLSRLTALLNPFCEWKRIGELKARMEEVVSKGQQSLEPFITDVLIDSAPLQLNNAKLFAAQRYPQAVSYQLKRPLPRHKRGDGKLHIGYASADFHGHATMRLMSELFEHHDHKRFKIYAYSYGKEDAYAERKRLMNAVDQFHNIRTTEDKDTDALIRRDGIDILIDLKGYTQNQRFRIMSARSAPIQMHYLGFPGTTGAQCMDYFITDPIASPVGAEKKFTENLIRLPHSYQINDRTRAVPTEALTRSSYGLPEEGFVFCDFNNSYKIIPFVFDSWMRLLKAVEGSVLWIYETHPEATAKLKQIASEKGIDPTRIIPAPLVSQEEHMARYLRADMVIDTYPVVGHTTTSDALWCGVPVVTMAGETFISRVAASLLHAVGLPELVTTNLADYEALALSLARDPARLKQLRRHLAEGRMRFPLFDSMTTARAIEKAYLHAAELHDRGIHPRSFAVTDDLQIKENAQ